MAFVLTSIASRKLGEEPLVQARRIRSVQKERLRLRDLAFFEDGLCVPILASRDCPDPLKEELVLGEVYSLPDVRLLRGVGVPVRGGEAWLQRGRAVFRKEPEARRMKPFAKRRRGRRRVHDEKL